MMDEDIRCRRCRSWPCTCVALADLPPEAGDAIPYLLERLRYSEAERTRLLEEVEGLQAALSRPAGQVTLPGEGREG